LENKSKKGFTLDGETNQHPIIMHPSSEFNPKLWGLWFLYILKYVKPTNSSYLPKNIFKWLKNVVVMYFHKPNPNPKPPRTLNQK
jgi:hypothetical protein